TPQGFVDAGESGAERGDQRSVFGCKALAAFGEEAVDRLVCQYGGLGALGRREGTEPVEGGVVPPPSVQAGERSCHRLRSLTGRPGEHVAPDGVDHGSDDEITPAVAHPSAEEGGRGDGGIRGVVAVERDLTSRVRLSRELDDDIYLPA